MTLRYVSGAFIAIVLSCGLVAVALAQAQTREAGLLPPEESAVITVAGCLQYHDDEYVLANPKLGPIANVPEGTCQATVDERAIDLKDTDDFGINQSMLGHWVEVNGRLERETDADLSNLRELEIRSFRMVPVLPPPVVISQSTEAAPAPEPPIAPPEPPVAGPVGTTGASEPALPQTASPLPVIGLLGLLSLAGGLGFRFYRSRG
jgi:hypothetical protein